MADELYQEFFLALCEITDQRLVEAFEGKFLDVFCVGIINNIWLKRGRVKTYANGSTNPLYQLSNNIWWIDESDPYEEPHQKYMKNGSVKAVMIPGDQPYDIIKDIQSTRAVEHMKELIEKAKDSEDKNERFRARVFDYSRFLYKNTRQFSKASGIPYNVCLEAYNNFKEKIKSAHLCRIS